MTYPDNFEHKIDFIRLKTLLKGHCLGSMGKENADKITFINEHELLISIINETDEFRQILLSDREFPTENYFDLRGVLKKTKISGAYIEAKDLQILQKSLFTFKSIKEFFKDTDKKEFTYLKQVIRDLAVYPMVSQNINKLIDDEGLIKDKASPDLYKIRQELEQRNRSLSGKIQQILHKAQEQGIVEKNTQLAFREGKAVIPIDVTKKRKINGYIHDESATGRTAYIEPAAIVEINNAIKELQYAEKREIIKILIAFADFLKPYTDDLINNYEIIGNLDLIRAKAKFAIQIDAIKPEIKDTPIINWKRARHPLMHLSFNRDNKAFIPQDIILDQDNRILLLSGPNAGGKSVCLKTTGIIQYMFQCGMLVPLEEGSQMGIFSDVFIHIGDEQSIENDLSTYSGYLKNMLYFLNHTNKGTMILIDEFGSGTEPIMGGAIAESLLSEFIKSKTFGVITTHYTSLKQYATETEGIINGALLFDTKKLKPLYRLEIGKPGNSFAFEIARTAGIPEDILNDAAIKLGKGHIEFDKQLQELQQDKQYIEEKRDIIDKKQKEASRLLEDYKEALDDIKKLRKEIIGKAKREAQQLLDSSNQKIENTIRIIKETEADKQKTLAARKKLEQYKDETRNKDIIDKRLQKIKSKTDEDSLKLTDEKNQKPQKYHPKKQDNKIRIGDIVKIKGSDMPGSILAIKDKKATIQIGSMTSTQNINKLVKIKGNEAEKVTRQDKTRPGTSKTLIGKNIAGFKNQVDLRGYRGEDAINEVRNFIDQAIMAGAKQISILHGKGSGILRQMIREYLRTEPAVVSFRDEHPDRGGSGITLVDMDNEIG